MIYALDRIKTLVMPATIIGIIFLPFLQLLHYAKSTEVGLNKK